MNILLIDKDQATKNFLEIMFSQTIEKFNLITVSNFPNGIEEYTDNNIDIILVDYSYPEYNKLLQEILKINPRQQTITLSKEISYSSDKGCNFCIENYNRRRLLKPFQAKSLIKILESFKENKCQYFQYLNNLKNILPNILNRFIYCQYNKDEKTILFETTNSILHTRNFTKVMDILSEHSIKYNIIDLHKIQIH